MRTTSMASMALVFTLLIAGCTITSSTSSTTTQQFAASGPGESMVEFSQDGELVGSMLVRAGTVQNGLVRFFIEVPYFSEDHRLDSLTLEFRSDVPAPLITLEPSSGSLTTEIAFQRVTDGADAFVRLHIADTGPSSDRTVLLQFVAAANVFGENGLRLHATLGFNAGTVRADLVVTPARTILAANSCESFRTLAATAGEASAPFVATSTQCGPLHVDNTGQSPEPGTLVTTSGQTISLEFGASHPPSLIEARVYEGDGVTADFFRWPDELPGGPTAVVSAEVAPPPGSQFAFLSTPGPYTLVIHAQWDANAETFFALGITVAE